MSNDVPPEVSVREAARLLGIHENTVRNLADKGTIHVARRLPGSGYRRFNRADIERMRREMWEQFAPDTVLPDRTNRVADATGENKAHDNDQETP